MTQDYFQQIKSDLLSEYKNDLCTESVDAIEKASTPEEFIGLLTVFSAYLKRKNIPEVWWVKKWFDNPQCKEIAESNGVYFDGFHALVNPEKPIIAMGDAQLFLTYTKPHLYNVTLQDDSICDVTTFYTCVVNVMQKGNSRCNVKHKENLSKIKIRKI